MRQKYEQNVCAYISELAKAVKMEDGQLVKMAFDKSKLTLETDISMSEQTRAKVSFYLALNELRQESLTEEMEKAILKFGESPMDNREWKDIALRVRSVLTETHH